MSGFQWFGVVAATAFVVWWLSAVAGRLDRVHIRRDEALISLRLQLALRMSAVAKLLTSEVLDPVSANVLAEEVENVTAAVERSVSEYLAAESEMTSALCQVFDDVDEVRAVATSSSAAHALGDLAAACRRVELARRFHNDAVGAAQLLHRRKVVRYLRLAGHTPWPEAVDMADTVPAGLEQFA